METKQTILTSEGLARLEEELEELKTVKRKDVADKIKVALSFGDLSENSEYDEAKNEQAIIEARIAQLDAMLKNAKVLDGAVKDMAIISGQKPLVTKAKKSVANFKLREGMNIGCKVTLRGDRMYEFADRLINIALPRVRDFRGVKANSFDGRGNYTMGIKEQLIFPEIEYDKVDKIRGMDIVFVTTANTDEEARELLRLFGMPFAK